MKQNLGLYIHIPFCKKKCSYCDFYSITDISGENIQEYLSCLEKEIVHYAGQYRDIFFLDTIYIGGGTPGLLTAGQLSRLLAILKENFSVSENCEITIEMNPESLKEEHLFLFSEKQVSRLSLGIQSFNNKVLRTIGRLADHDKIISTVNLIQKYKIENYSFDLIFGLPYQTQALWQKDLETAVQLNPKHLSIYSLMLDQKTALYNEFKNDPDIFPGEDQIPEYYYQADEYLGKNRIFCYEISNFSIKGYESRHNLKYWKQQSYLGLGANASSTIYPSRWQNIRDIHSYCDNIKKTGSAATGMELLDNRTLLNEKIMLNLRLTEGLDFSRLSKQEQFRSREKLIKEFQELDLIHYSGKKICLTLKGKMLSNRIISQLIL